jgi:RNase P protein component
LPTSEITVDSMPTSHGPPSRISGTLSHKFVFAVQRARRRRRARQICRRRRQRQAAFGNNRERAGCDGMRTATVSSPQ